MPAQLPWKLPETKLSLPPETQNWDDRNILTCLALTWVLGDLNSDPHTCAAGVLLTKLSPQPLFFLNTMGGVSAIPTGQISLLYPMAG